MLYNVFCLSMAFIMHFYYLATIVSNLVFSFPLLLLLLLLLLVLVFVFIIIFFFLKSQAVC